VKEIGKFITNIRTLGSDLTTTFENNMESQLQLQEIRKAQRELNDAFSFRRSINVDPTEAFATNAASPRVSTDGSGAPLVMEEEGATMATTTTAVAAATTASDTANPPRRKKVLRRRRVTPAMEEESSPSKAATTATTAGSTTTAATSSSSNWSPSTTAPSTTTEPVSRNIPDLEMPQDPFVTDSPYSTSSTRFTGPQTTTTASRTTFTQQEPEYTAAEIAEIEREFAQYTSLASPPSSYTTGGTLTPEQSRFQQQLSGTWNQQVMGQPASTWMNNDTKDAALSPLAKVMEMLALLEEEKVAASQRLEDEFQQRAAMDEEYYRKQRALLEDAVAQIQPTTTSSSSSNSSTRI
jgi:hypothetical protein